MDWYFGNDAEDLVVPKDYEQSEMISTPESWSQWGLTSFGGSFLQKKNLNSDTNMTREELTFNGGKNFYTSIDMTNSNNENSKSNNSSMSQELYNNGDSLLWNDQADFQQFAEEEARINHMDDIFFSSLLEEDPTKSSAENRDNTILGNDVNVSEGEMVSLPNVGSHGQRMGSSKYLKTHDFSPSIDWGNAEVSTTYQMLKEYTSKDDSMEESVLKELERVTAQFTDKTRIRLRDAFYRLADSSKQSENTCQDREPMNMMTSDDDTLKSGETEDSEAKTNVIDRAVANLIFYKSDYEESEDQREMFSCYQHQTDENDDAEVPIGGRGMQELPQSTAY